MILRKYDFSRYTIQDPIHGGITFGSIERAVIDHRLFQRLHGLRQNALLHLIFPSANHTRFDHSIGVMCLANEFFDSIMKNQGKICGAGSSRQSFQEPYRVDDKEIENVIKALSDELYYAVMLRVAALFHDIGHGPLSHLFDKFFPSYSEMEVWTRIPGYEHVHERLLPLKGNTTEPIRHEILSCIIATHVISDCGTEIQNFGIDPVKMARDVCAIIDDRITPTSQLEIAPYQVHKLFHDILSSDIDVDRMDYLLRDSHMCGVNYGFYDPERILKSMCAYGRTDTRELRVAIRYSSLGAFEDLLFSRYQMHGQIYGHKTNRACYAMLMRIQDRLRDAKWTWYRECTSLESLLTRFGELDDHSFIDELLEPELDYGAGKVKEIAEKLFIERKLVKRVFEERVVHSDPISTREENILKRWREHQTRLEKEGFWFVGDVFENKGPKIHEQNYHFKVLKKNTQGFYMVHELKDFTTVLQHLPPVEYLYRIYCKMPNVNKAKSLLPD
jgi:HD superfamily phosphohydrolase